MDYREEVLKNCPGFSTDLMEKKLSLAGLGLAGEAAELLELYADPNRQYFAAGCPPEIGVKIVREMGDVYWYLEYLGATLRVNRELCMNATAELPVSWLLGDRVASDISVNAGAIADLVKKVLHHNVALDAKRDDIVIRMGLAYRGLSSMGAQLGVSPEQVMQANIEKLRRRHPNGWTPASQQAKVDEKVTG